MLFALTLLFIFTLVGWLFIRGTVFAVKYFEHRVRGNRSPVFPLPRECSRYEAAFGRFSSLMSFREFVLVGWTCPTCGSEFDQLGNVTRARAWGANLRDLKNRGRISKRADSADSNDSQKSPIERLFED